MIRHANGAGFISVIIPAINEAAVISETIRRAALSRDTEIIVVDGGSQDATMVTARSQGTRVMSAPPGRARQMNAGAAAARGDLFLFLHADTLLPPAYDLLIRQTMAASGTAAGAFRLRIGTRTAALRFIERVANFRSQVLQMPYGDQGLFLHRRTFGQLGGFSDTPIMEDFDMVRRLRQKGRIATVSSPVVTSSRRWLRLGVLRTWLINQGVVLAFYAGWPRDRIVTWYRGRRDV